MYDFSLLTDPKTGEELVSVNALTAAKFLHTAVEQVHAGLQQQKLPIGWATMSPKGKWSYTILCTRLKAYAMAHDLQLTA